MNDNNVLSEILNTIVASSVLNADQITKSIVSVLLFVLAVFWVYCSIRIYIDVKRRFQFSDAIQILFLIYGVITGPFGLVLYGLLKPRYTLEDLDFMKTEHKFYYHQASKVRDCIKCGAYVLEAHIYCTNCGTQNRFKCEKCKALTDYDDKFCYSCGKSFAGREEKILQNITPKSGSLSKRVIKKSETSRNEIRTVKKVKLGTVDVASNLKPIASDLSKKVKSLSSGFNNVVKKAWDESKSLQKNFAKKEGNEKDENVK